MMQNNIETRWWNVCWGVFDYRCCNHCYHGDRLFFQVQIQKEEEMKLNQPFPLYLADNLVFGYKRWFLFVYLDWFKKRSP
jgi:hypothetical protein